MWLPSGHSSNAHHKKWNLLEAVQVLPNERGTGRTTGSIHNGCREQDGCPGQDGGTYVSVDPVHLQAYVDEQAYRFNNREFEDADRFVNVLSQIAGKCLTFQQLITKELDSPLG